MSWETEAPGGLWAQDARMAIAAARSLARLEAYAQALWADWSAQRLDDARTQALAEAIEARRRALRGLDMAANRIPAAATKAQGRPSCFPPKRKACSSPDRAASLERRRVLAASGVMPPALAARFTTGELAALRILADEVRDKGACRLTLGEIAARAGVSVTTARNGLRAAAALGLVLIAERRRAGRPNLPNLVRIVSREWTAWIGRGAGRRKATAPLSRVEGGGCKKAGATETLSFRKKGGDRADRSRTPISGTFLPPNAAVAG